MSGYFADPDVTPEESAAALDRLAAEYGVAEDVAAIREAGQNGADHPDYRQEWRP